LNCVTPLDHRICSDWNLLATARDAPEQNTAGFLDIIDNFLESLAGDSLAGDIYRRLLPDFQQFGISDLLHRRSKALIMIFGTSEYRDVSFASELWCRRERRCSTYVESAL
jgi:hypothetical protein